MANNHIIVPHNYVYIERTDRTIEWDWIRIENLFCNLPETQLCLYQRSSHANPHKCFLVCLQNFDNFSILQFPEVNQTPLYWCLVCAGRWEGQKVKVSPPLLHFIALFITLSHSLYHSRHHSLNYSLYHTLPSSLTGSDSSLLSVWKSSLPIPFVIYSCSEITNIALQLVLVNSSCDRCEPRSPQSTTPTPMHLC